MGTKTIKIGRKLFEFRSHADWVNHATTMFHRYREQAGYLASQRTLCIDSRGRVCMHGLDFKRADESRAFPVRVYSIT